MTRFWLELALLAFWTPLTADGGIAAEWRSLESETEVGPERVCYQCDHEWVDGEEGGE